MPKINDDLLQKLAKLGEPIRKAYEKLEEYRKNKNTGYSDTTEDELVKQLNTSIEQVLKAELDVPDNFYQTLLEQLLEREYLNDTEGKMFYCEPCKQHQSKTIHWMQITRLPVHPNENESYDMLSRWQGVLTTLHSWGYGLRFLLLRYDGKTKLFVGTTSEDASITTENAIDQLREACFGSMPGMGMRILKGNDAEKEIYIPLKGYGDEVDPMKSIGAITGIPSFRDSEQKGLLQTLDQLAFGIRNQYGEDRDYAMLVIADPIMDGDIADIISDHRRLSSKIHTGVRTSTTKSVSVSKNKDNAVTERTIVGGGASIIGAVIGGIAGSKLGNPDKGTRIGATVGAMLGQNMGSSLGNVVTSQMQQPTNVSVSNAVTREYLDKFAEYAEIATDHHIDRLNQGRNYGFWNTGIYVLSHEPKEVKSVTGILRSIYSGEETYYEPIRLHLFNENSNALDIVRDRFELLPMIDPGVAKQPGFNYRKNQWHVFGKNYEYLSTPINTKELALVTSLPRRDVPGLRFVKTAVRFANNPAELKKEDRITLGKIVDMGIEQSNTYDIDPNSLVRHALVAGSTGSGKSTTCKQILEEVLKRDVPIMVIEPAKDDYVRWAIDMNKNLPEEKQFKIYMPGVSEFEGMKIEPLQINPFEPAGIKGATVDLLQHCESFITLLIACLPSEEVIPILIEETVFEVIQNHAERNNRDLDNGEIEPLSGYPRIKDLERTAAEIMEKKQYSQQNKDNLTEILLTRFKYLRRGTRGKILNVFKSVDYGTLFSGNVIINVSRLAGTKDKSLVMSLLMQALYEYRISCYVNDPDYRKKAQDNQLMHLALIEEAHNVLLKPEGTSISGNPQRAAADLFGNMLSEVRGYGQGFIVVDQVPTRLIDDAIKNTNYKIVHRLTAPDDQEIMGSCMAFRDDQKYIIPALEKGHAIICGDEDDAAAWVKIPAPRS